MKRPRQIHTNSNGSKPNPEQVWKFLEDYNQIIQGKDQVTQAISLRIPKNILEAFKSKAQFKGLKYQTQIVKLMRDWILFEGPKK